MDKLNKQPDLKAKHNLILFYLSSFTLCSGDPIVLNISNIVNIKILNSFSETTQCSFKCFHADYEQAFCSVRIDNILTITALKSDNFSGNFYDRTFFLFRLRQISQNPDQLNQLLKAQIPDDIPPELRDFYFPFPFFVTWLNCTFKTNNLVEILQSIYHYGKS